MELLADGGLIALVKIVIADLSMSLDNVLAIAGAAKGNLTLLAIGLGIAIIAMAAAATYIAKLLDRFPIIMWVGLFIVLYVAVEMIYRSGFEVTCNSVTTINCSDNPVSLIRAGFGI